jgi:dTDP-4-dehydrorhamnose 3,5-epimerase
MRIVKTEFEGLVVIEPDLFKDSRGYFMESFNSAVFESHGIGFKPVQDNESGSSRGVVRGLHYQLNPFAQAKMIRVISGKIFDVAADLRKTSPTFGKWFGIFLDSETKKSLLIPRGFAHGFSVLSETAVIQYKCDNIYNKALERGVAWNDKTLAINWHLDGITPVISEKDSLNPELENAEYNF